MTRQDGYIMIHSPLHPKTHLNHYIFRSRLVMEKKIGRFLKPEEVVHHIGNKDDDRVENLILFENQAAHVKFHAIIRRGLSTPTGMKYCFECKRNKPLEMFHNCKSRIDKKHPVCKGCRCADERRRNLKKKDLIKQI